MRETYVLALDLGGTHATALAYASGQGVLVSTTVPSRVQDGPQATLKRLATELKRVRSLSEIPMRAFRAVGVGAPGPLDPRRGLILSAPNLPGWRHVPAAAGLRRFLRLPVRLDNDARCAAWGEHRRGAGQGLRDMALLTLGTGVGGGLILDGRLRRGPDATAGELGFLYLDRSPKAPRCAFGLPGSLEALLSGPALARQAAAALKRHPHGALWRLCQGRPGAVTAAMAHQALRAGDPCVRETWTEAGRALGLAVASLINALNLEAVIVGGGVMAGGGRELLALARSTARAATYPQAFKRCRIAAAELGTLAGAVGAAELALGQPA